jgi:autotransporter-associated beta strand protein
LKFDQLFTAGNDVSVLVSNSGTFSGTNTVQGDAVAIINGSQFISSGAFQVGNNFNCELANTGNDSSHGTGLSNIGQLNAAQMILQTTGTVGNNCTFTVSNTGINSAQTTNFPDFLGYLNDQQFSVGNTFQAGNNFNLNVTNTGTDTSNGHGGYQVAVINSNSGTSGNQILFQHGCALGSHANISATNSGTYNGTNTNGGSNVGGMNLQQIAIGDSTAPGSHSFVAGDFFSLNASNSGQDSSHGTGSNAVGDVSTDQVAIFTPVTLGNHANLTFTNSGHFIGNASATYVNVGSAGGCQLNCLSTVSIGNNFTLSASNSGTNSGSGIGGFFIGDLITGQQVAFHDSLIIGNNASITISNTGSNSSNTTNNNQVGSFMGYGKQLLAGDLLQVGNDFSLEITNSGFDDSTGSGGNFVGFMNNNTVDNSGSQIHLAEGGTIGDRATISLSNTGTYQGSNTTAGNLIGTIAGQQLYSVSDFQAGNDFALTVSNSGIDNASGQNNNSIGTVGRAQVQVDGTCTLGTNASIVASNSGTNSDTTGTFNNIGVINGSQLIFNGNFTAEKNLNISASNTAMNAGDPNNFVGQITGSQLVFSQNCTLNDGSVISALNSGAVGNSQIVFGQGFNVVSGKVTIKAINQGTVGSFGIDIQGSNAGGNANIILGNCSLNIGTTLPTFTIARLDGDSTCIVQSQPQLIINTDSSTQAEFSGVIQDFPATTSTLVKTGPGTQTLSGINTYTGLTSIQEGVLIINGAIAGDILISPTGKVKGNGSIGGAFTNTGIVSPGESIGTLTIGNFINDNGTYAVEVNGLGQSDLIDVSGAATLNGGSVVVSSEDGTFRFHQPYTILTAGGGVTGTFASSTSLAFIKPVLTYDPDNVYLTLFSDLSRAAEKCNQFGVARNLDNIVDLNSEQSLLISTIANLPLEDVQESLESLSGFQYTNDVLVTNITTSRFLRRLYDPLRSLVTGSNCSPTCNECTSWLETGYGTTNLHGSNSHKMNFNSYQITGGIQKTFRHNFTYGLAGSYEYDNVRYHDGKANRNSAFAGAYGLYKQSMYYGLFDIVYGYSSNQLRRTIDIGNLHYKAHSKPNLNLFTVYGEAGFDMSSGCVLIQPFLGMQIGKSWRGSISENQTEGFGLSIDKHNWSTTISRLGLHLSTCNLNDCIDASFDIAWNQLWSSSKNSAVGRFKEFGNPFSICGNKLDNYSIDYALTFTTYLCDNLKGYFELDGEWWQHANTFNVLGGVEYSW